MTRYALRFSDRVEVRRVTDDAEIARFPAPGGRNSSVFGFSPDGRYLATTHQPGDALTVWDIDRQAVAVNDPGPVSRGRQPDSARTAGGSPWAIRTASSSCTTWRPVSPAGGWPGPAPAQDLAFRPDGAQIAVISSEKGPTCRILESESGRLVRSITLPTTGEGVAWSPDGSIAGDDVR